MFSRESVLEPDVCKYRQYHYFQHTVCLKLGKWIPDPNLIDCVNITCPEPAEPPHATVIDEICLISNIYLNCVSLQIFHTSSEAEDA